LQAGTLRIDPSPQSFEALLKVAQTQLQTLTQTHPLVLHVPDSLPAIVADKYRIAQVLVNLIENAAKFSPEGTPITIGASETHDGVQVDVSDQGVGIPPEDRKRVFEAFQQVDRKIPNQSRGAGLGLAICKGIIEAHGGRIWVQDKEVGTTISFVLPTALIKLNDNKDVTG
jgi:two-component system, OmpR family, sensor histidine kinase KdpD